MLFFRTISLVAALAFVTLSSAGPVDGDGLALSGDVFARDIDLSELALPVKRDGNVTVSFLYNNCKQNVQDIIVRIRQYIVLLSCLQSWTFSQRLPLILTTMGISSMTSKKLLPGLTSSSIVYKRLDQKLHWIFLWTNFVVFCHLSLKCATGLNFNSLYFLLNALLVRLLWTS